MALAGVDPSAYSSGKFVATQNKSSTGFLPS
ncbi:hypothetical protein ACFQZT_14465 [Paenibacillus sp. GCM10027628]